MSSSTDTTVSPDPRRWWVLAVIGFAQLMVVLDITIVNIALPSAQHALHFSDDGRQWIITAYALAFGSLLLLGGKLSDIFGRKVTFITGLIGFAIVSAIGGASVSFAMLVVARACQGAFGALLAPAALSLLTTTFQDPKERGRAFGVFGAIASGGAAVGLLLGGLLTEYLSWRWCLYVNLVFALIAAAGAAVLLRETRQPSWQRLDFIGVIAGGGSMFCVVYGFSNASLHSWGTPSTWGFLIAAGVLFSGFIIRETRAKNPLLPLSIVADRDRGGANVAILASGAGIFGVFLFLTFYLQQTLHYSPVGAGLAFLPMVAMIMIFSNLANVVLLPRIGPKPLISTGLLASAGAMVWLTSIGPNTSYVHDVLGPTLLIGAGFGLNFGSALNTGTLGITAATAGVASATLNTMQQIGGSIGTSLLNTVATQSTKNFIAARGPAARRGGPAAARALTGQALVHGYTTAFWWSAAIFAGGAVLAGLLLRAGPPGARRPASQPAGSRRQGRHARQASSSSAPPPAAAPPADTTAQPTAPPADTTPQPAAPRTTAPQPAVPQAEAGPSADAVSEAKTAPQPAVPEDQTAPQPAISDGDTDSQPRISESRTAPQPGVTEPENIPTARPAVTDPDTSATARPAAPDPDTSASGQPAASAAGTGATAQPGVTEPDTNTTRQPAAPEGHAAQDTDAIRDETARRTRGGRPAGVVPQARGGQEAAAGLRGTVRTTEGIGIPGARVSLSDSSGATVAATATGPSGDYVIDDLPDGQYTLTATGYPPATTPVEVTAGARPACDIELEYPTES